MTLRFSICSRYFLCIFCLCLSCSSAGEKKRDWPDLNVPHRIIKFKQISRLSHPPGVKGDWTYHLSLARSMLDEAHLLLEKSTSIAARWIFPGSESPDKNPASILLENAGGKGKNARLLEEGILACNESWANLAESADYFLMAAVIIAELRQKWASRGPSEEEDWKKIASGLESLPTMEQLESEQKKIEKIELVFRQLMKIEEGIFPPFREGWQRESHERDLAPKS